MASSEELLAQLVDLAEEQLRWQRASVLPQVRETIDQTLTTTQLRKAYEGCDGSASSTELAKAAGVSKAAFSNWARRWRDLGIAFEAKDRKIKHLATLKSLGLPVELDDEKKA
jgi:CRP-like cAMP-binding protein